MLNENVQIDDNIKPLITYMNNLDWILINSCCEGHPDDEYHNNFYVQFYCKINRIDHLSKLLNKVDRFIDKKHFPFILECIFNYNDNVQGCQNDAPLGSIALHIMLNPTFKEGNTEKEKFQVIEYITKEFENLNIKIE